MTVGRHRDPMKGGNPAIVRPAAHQVTQVDDKGSGRRQDVDPRATPRFDLQATGFVVRLYDGDGTVV